MSKTIDSVKVIKKNKTVHIDVVSGYYGINISINNTRIAGEKQWSTGKVIFSAEVPISEIKNAMKDEYLSIKAEDADPEIKKKFNLS